MLSQMKVVPGVPNMGKQQRHAAWAKGLPVIALVLFGIGAAPLVALALFSPGLGSEGWFGVFSMVYGVITLAMLILAAIRRAWMWVFVLVQAALLAAVCYETLSRGALYVGT